MDRQAGAHELDYLEPLLDELGGVLPLTVSFVGMCREEAARLIDQFIRGIEDRPKPLSAEYAAYQAAPSSGQTGY